MSLPRYPKYRPSGLDWLGEVPEHWPLKRLRFVAKMNPSKGELAGLDRDMEVSFLPMEAIGDDGVTDLSTTRPLGELESGYTYFRDGDVVVAKITPCFENGKGALMKGLVGGVGFGTTELFVARPHTSEAGGAFLHYLFLSPFFRRRGEASMYGAGGQKRVPDEFVRNFEAAWPSVSEQGAIVEFLDRETSKIDALISDQERLVELLKEKRRAIISHAVTKGVNPDAPLKPSGIGWLGDVPSHWTIAPLGSRYTVQLGKMLDSSRVTGAHLRPYLRVADVQWGQINVEELPAMDFAESDRKKFRLLPGDLLVNEGGSYPGRSAIWVGGLPECYYQKALHRLRPIRSADDTTRFAFYLMRWAAEQGVFVAGGNETTIEHLPAERLRRYRLPFPPFDEQASIASYLDRAVAKLDALAADVEEAVDFLLERRTTLISAAVTGRIDVRRRNVADSDADRPYTTGFARQLLAAEILTHCYSHATTGRVKLQKLIHLCEHVAEIEEVQASYSRMAAGPFDNKVMFGVAKGLEQQRWFAEVRQPSRTSYRPLEKAGDHKKYLARWHDKMPKLDKVLDLLGHADTRQCEIVSTLYAAWNDLLIDGNKPTDAAIIREASDPSRWHESKSKIPVAKWPAALAWMRAKGLVPTGFGRHTRREPAKPK